MRSGKNLLYFFCIFQYFFQLYVNVLTQRRPPLGRLYITLSSNRRRVAPLSYSTLCGPITVNRSSVGDMPTHTPPTGRTSLQQAEQHSAWGPHLHLPRQLQASLRGRCKLHTEKPQRLIQRHFVCFSFQLTSSRCSSIVFCRYHRYRQDIFVCMQLTGVLPSLSPSSLSLYHNTFFMFNKQTKTNTLINTMWCCSNGSTGTNGCCNGSRTIHSALQFFGCEYTYNYMYSCSFSKSLWRCAL